MRITSPALAIAWLCALAACSRSAPEAVASKEGTLRSIVTEEGASSLSVADEADRPARASGEKKRAKASAKMEDDAAMPASAPAPILAAEAKGGGRGPAPEEALPETVPTRAWFPETFLFAPRVVTDDKGEAALDVPVPDRLTTWRVLALAHSRKGAQAGSVASFASNLPVSVDVVVPAYLVAGDRVSLPIQVVNSTDAALSRALTTRVDGGRLGGVPGTVRVGAQQTTTVMADLEALEPGVIAVEATVPGEDSVARTIPVKPAGRPFHREASGTLGAARSPTVDVPLRALDGSVRATLTVNPGALSLLRAELTSAPQRSSIHDDAFLLALAGRAPALSAKLGAPADPKVVDRLARVAGQRLARHAVRGDSAAAMWLAPGALLHPQESLIGRNGAHLADIVARAQRPDGTFFGETGMRVGRLMMMTAQGLEAVRAHPDKTRARAAALRARGAFERFSGQIDDPYTAAAVVASGAVDGPLADELKKKIMEAVVARGDGARVLPVPPGAVRADGSRPTDVEATALAVLALREHPPASALLPDLGATLLAAYRPGSGFGDGATNLRALDAIALLFSDPLPTKVAVSFTVGGKATEHLTLEGEALRQQSAKSLLVPASVLAAARAAAAKAAPPKPKTGPGDDEEGAGPDEEREPGVEIAEQGMALAVAVVADPPVPGLSFVLTIEGSEPWPAPPKDAGLAVAVELPTLSVGRTATVTLRATAPDGMSIRVQHALPAGVDAVRASLQALEEKDVIISFEILEGKVVLVAPEREQGQAFVARYDIIPTLAGTLHPEASSAEVDGDEGSRVYFPPPVWRVAR